MADRGKSGCGKSKHKGKGKGNKSKHKGFLCSMLLGFVMLGLGGCSEGKQYAAILDSQLMGGAHPITHDTKMAAAFAGLLDFEAQAQWSATGRPLAVPDTGCTISVAGRRWLEMMAEKLELLVLQATHEVSNEKL